MNVKVYSTPTCPYCRMAKNYFHSKKIDFVDIDVSQNSEKAQEMMDLSGQMGVPVIVIGEDVIVGFNQAEIEKKLSS